MLATELAGPSYFIHFHLRLYFFVIYRKVLTKKALKCEKSAD